MVKTYTSAARRDYTASAVLGSSLHYCAPRRLRYGSSWVKAVEKKRGAIELPDDCCSAGQERRTPRGTSRGEVEAAVLGGPPCISRSHSWRLGRCCYSWWYRDTCSTGTSEWSVDARLVRKALLRHIWEALPEARHVNARAHLPIGDVALRKGTAAP